MFTSQKFYEQDPTRMDTNNQSMILKGIFMYMESFLAVKVWHDHVLLKKQQL